MLRRKSVGADSSALTNSSLQKCADSGLDYWNILDPPQLDSRRAGFFGFRKRLDASLNSLLPAIRKIVREVRFYNFYPCKRPTDWFSRVLVRALDWRTTGHGFDTRRPRFRAATPSKSFTSIMCLLHTWRMSYVVWLTATLEGGCVQHPRLCWCMVPPTRRMTIGDRAFFLVAGARVWNALPSFVTDSAAVATFKSHLKTYLFVRSLSWDRDLV